MTRKNITIKGKAMKKEQTIEEGDGFAFSFFNVAQSPVNKQCSPTLTTGNSCGVAVGVKEEGIPIKDSSAKGYMIAHEGDSVSLQFPGNKGGPVQRGMTSSLLCAKGCANGVVVRDNGIDIKVATKKGYMTAEEGDGVSLQYPGKTRGIVQKGNSPTLLCCEGCGNGVVVKDPNRIVTAGKLNVSPYLAADKVYSPNGLAPTIVCEHSGIAHPKVDVTEENKIIVAGEMTDTNFTQEKNVYSPNGVAPSVLARDYKSPKKIEIAGDLHIDGWHQCANDVHSPEGVSPTVCAQANNTRIKIQLAGEMTDTNYVKDRGVYSPDDASPPALVCSRSKIEVAGEMSDINGQIAKKVYSPEGCSPTVLCAGGGTGSKIKIEDRSEQMPQLDDGDVASMITPGREEKRQNGQRYKTDGNSFTVTCQDKHGIIKNDNGRLRIRYLTPRECWRLQGFGDDDFDKAVDAGMTKTALYTQAGNSIAVPCLEAIFKGIYIDKAFTKTIDITRW